MDYERLLKLGVARISPVCPSAVSVPAMLLVIEVDEATKRVILFDEDV